MLSLSANPNVSNVANVLKDEEQLATPLALLVLDLYGLEALEWDPETLQMQLRDDYKVQISGTTLSRIYAAFAVITTDAFYHDVSRFIQLSRVFAGNDFDVDVFSPAYLDEIMVALIEVFLLDPPEKPYPFHEEISGYVAESMKSLGVMRPVFLLREFFENPVEYAPTEREDDEEMFAAVYQVQQDREKELLQIAKDHVTLLISQLTRLPLSNGSTQTTLKNLEKLVGSL
jgi:hypothetical protein